MKVKNRFPRITITMVCLGILFLTNPAFCIEWVDLEKKQDGDTLSYDKGSVRKIGIESYRLWERIIYANENVKENVKTTVFVREINCQDSTHRIISIIDYDANGAQLFSGANDQTEWSAIPSDTIIDDLKKTVCPK